MARLGDNRYGKSRVRLSRITRLEDRHEFNEWTVHVMLSGDFEASFTKADNSKVLPTDTMKNTVYSVARGSQAKTIESFAMELGDYFLANNAQVSGVSIEIEERAWERIAVGGVPEPATFKLTGTELQTVHVTRERGGVWAVTSGVDGLTILKTTKSAFTGYVVDKLTTLKPATDRIFGTCATITWDYAAATPDYAEARVRIVDALLKDICRARQQERAAHALRHGKSRAGGSAGDRTHSSFHAESASSARRSQPLRPGQSQSHLRAHRRAAWYDRGHRRALIQFSRKASRDRHHDHRAQSVCAG